MKTKLIVAACFFWVSTSIAAESPTFKIEPSFYDAPTLVNPAKFNFSQASNAEVLDVLKSTINYIDSLSQRDANELSFLEVKLSEIKDRYNGNVPDNISVEGIPHLNYSKLGQVSYYAANMLKNKDINAVEVYAGFKGLLSCEVSVLESIDKKTKSTPFAQYFQRYANNKSWGKSTDFNKCKAQYGNYIGEYYNAFVKVGSEGSNAAQMLNSYTNGMNL